MRPVPPFALLDRWLSGCVVPGSARLHLPYDDILDVLRGFLAVWPVDEDWYLVEYPEVRRFLHESPEETATNHFRKFGYYNGYHPFADKWRNLRQPVRFDRLTQEFDVIVTRAGIHVDIGRNSFVGIVQSLLASVPVEEAWYRENYAQADRSLRRGDFTSASDHYAYQGYFVGFLPADPAVDDEWYVSRYRHVRNGLARGEAISAKDHFIRIGYGEGCQPNRNGQT
jgi:hypothetical protein